MLGRARQMFKGRLWPAKTGVVCKRVCQSIFMPISQSSVLGQPPTPTSDSVEPCDFSCISSSVKKAGKLLTGKERRRRFIHRKMSSVFDLDSAVGDLHPLSVLSLSLSLHRLVTFSVRLACVCACARCQSARSGAKRYVIRFCSFDDRKGLVYGIGQSYKRHSAAPSLIFDCLDNCLHCVHL